MASKKYLDYVGLQEFLAKLTARYGVALQFKGTVQNIAALPSLGVGTTAKEGYVYNIVEEGTTTSDFVEGEGKVLRAGSNVAVINTAAEGDPVVLKFDILAGFFSVDDKLTFGDTMPATPADGETFLYMGETTYTYDTVTGLTGAENPKALGYYEKNVSDEYVLTNDTEPLTVYKAYTDTTDTYFVKSATPQIGDTVYTITGGVVTDSGYTVDAIGTDEITVNSVAYARSSADDQYIAEKTYYDNKTEEYVTGVIYVYDQATSSWLPQTAGDTFVPITNQEIDDLFD